MVCMQALIEYLFRGLDSFELGSLVIVVDAIVMIWLWPMGRLGLNLAYVRLIIIPL